MPCVFSTLRRTAALVVAVVLLSAPTAWADESPIWTPPEGRIQPPVGVQGRIQPPVGSDRSLAKLVMTWLRARISIPTG